jgi:nitroreductase/NAD-dependent dihydropyrimidine dehydrogenase PreA subunit
MSVFTINPEKCIRCGMCVFECPPGVITMTEPEALPTMAEGGDERCIVCGHCVAVCVPGALSHRAMAPEDLENVIRRQLSSPAQAERLFKSRRSIRVYRKKPVPRELLAKAIDIARYAPSGHNSQPVHWLVVEDPQETRRLAGLVVDWMRRTLKTSPEIAEALRFDLIVGAWIMGIDVPLHGAPHVVVAHAPKDAPLAENSCSLALAYLELAAYSLGLGACWAGYFQLAATNHSPMVEALGLPEGHHSFGAVMMGYPKYRFSRIPSRTEARVTWR